MCVLWKRKNFLLTWRISSCLLSFLTNLLNSMHLWSYNSENYVELHYFNIFPIPIFSLLWRNTSTRLHFKSPDVYKKGQKRIWTKSSMSPPTSTFVFFPSFFIPPYLYKCWVHFYYLKSRHIMPNHALLWIINEPLENLFKRSSYIMNYMGNPRSNLDV